jgi:transmembrane sensor
MSEEQMHIDWEKLIAILEKPAAERNAVASTLSPREQEVFAWLQQQHGDQLLTGALQLDTMQAWKQTIHKIGAEGSKAPVRAVSFAWKKWVAAACLLLMAGAGWLTWKQYRPAAEGYQSVARGLAGHAPSGKIQLITADGKSVEVISVKELKEKDGTVIEVQEGQVTYKGRAGEESMQGPGNLVNTLIVPRGYMYNLVLSDGSKVWLNADSRIRYPVRFDKAERRVEIEGEAYFEVTHNEQWPFIVAVRNTETKVLGTSFDIKAYGKNVYTTLVTGRVQFSAPAGQPFILLPGRQAVYTNNTGAATTREVIAGDWIAWKDDDLVMIKMSLAELAEILERRYDVQVSFSEEQLKKVQYNGALHLTGDVVDILDNLEQTGNIHFAVKDKKIIVLPAIENKDRVMP